MDETKKDVQETQDHDDQSTGLTRRSFLTQVGIAGFVTATSSVLSISRHEPEHRSTPTVGMNDPENSVSKNPEDTETQYETAIRSTKHIPEGSWSFKTPV